VRSSAFRRLWVNRLRYTFAPLIVLLWAVRAQAATVVIVRPAGPSLEATETASRLHGELLSLGVDVMIVERPASRAPRATDSRAWVERLAVDRQADAVIDIVDRDGAAASTAVDVWVFERRSGRREASRVAQEPNVENAAERLAIRAIEVLRSNLVEIDLGARGQRGATVAREPPAVAEQGAVARPAPGADRVHFEAGAAVVSGLDGVGPAVSPIVRFGWAPGSWLVLQATLAGLGSRPTVTTAAGGARVAQQYGLLGACYCAPAPRGIGLYVALSAGVLRMAIDGQAEAPALAHSLERWSFLLDAGLGARIRLPGRYYLTAAAHVQVAEPHVAIHIADTVVATTGYPNLLFSFTLGAWL
jgi:hypothetical protein